MMILNSEKYRSETFETVYRIHMKLTVFNFSRDDNTTYKCVAKNSLGETEGDIKLNEIYMPPKAKEIRSGKSKSEGICTLTYKAPSPRNEEFRRQRDTQGASQGTEAQQLPKKVPQSAYPTNHEQVLLYVRVKNNINNNNNNNRRVIEEEEEEEEEGNNRGRETAEEMNCVVSKDKYLDV
ncbi:putative Neurotrimin-like 2 [Homarus americanus]|uniref:Putative Neurotrimin-like 2 n=1 Tax=Homarus americanus TaxID=6706 RepID=A0A8J5MKM3_HOMAM|nr:putative Neurotrimin-like 2 [Homarus americanus]